MCPRVLRWHQRVNVCLGGFSGSVPGGDAEDALVAEFIEAKLSGRYGQRLQLGKSWRSDGGAMGCAYNSAGST